MNEPVPQPQPQPAPEEAPRVLVIRDHRVVREVRVTDALRIGRLPDNDLVIDDEQVSGYHGRIERAGPGWRYTDVGSTNGSIVSAGPTLRAQQSVTLDEDVQILLGSTVLDVRVQGQHVADERSAAPAAPQRPRLVIVAGGRHTLRPLPEQGGSVGRGPGVDVAITDPSISQRHAEIRREAGGYVLSDAGSRNGTRLGIERVVGSRPLPSGSHIILGDADVLFVHDGAPEPDPDALFAYLRSQKQLGRIAEQSARRELQRGARTLGEILVLSGAVTPGEWVEAVAATHAEPEVLTRSRGRRVLLTVVLVALLGALAWLIAAR